MKRSLSALRFGAGLIVNDGTTAYIKANGKVLAEIHGGIYDFVDPDELKRVLESRTGGAAGLMAGSGRFLINALLGRRVKDRFDDKDAPRTAALARCRDRRA